MITEGTSCIFRKTRLNCQIRNPPATIIVKTDRRPSAPEKLIARYVSELGWDNDEKKHAGDEFD